MASEEEKLEKKKKHDAESAADLEKVTDFAEEQEISIETNLSTILSNIAEQKREEILKQTEHERELSKVQISKEDVEIIMNELEVTKLLAERTLREKNGNVIAALTALVTC